MEITEVIRHGILTEKSAALQQTSRDVGRRRGPKTGEIVPRYTFKVALEANKYQIRQAVEAMFPGVKVVSVNTMRMPGKARTMRTRKGIMRKEARPWKKAIVTLADGQSIPELQP
jgi:large subunit ribosomal protein L23